MATDMFIRFASPYRSRWSGRELGVFHSAGRLQDSGTLSGDEVEQLEELLSYFNAYLPVPPCYRDAELPLVQRDRAICWFRTDAERFIRRIWTVVCFLKDHGVPMQMCRTRLPGRVLYEDEFQVCAVPFRRQREWQQNI